MNLNQLEYFIAAAETLNFTKAAQRCFISQTAMSLQIKSLEEIVGVPLFVRDKHHVELTAAGQVYLHEARAILERNREAVSMARTAATGIKGKLCVGFIRGFGNDELINILQKFHSEYPKITLSLKKDNRSALSDMLDKGKCDIIFTNSAIAADAADRDHLFIKSFPLMAALPAGHPLSGKKSLTYHDLKKEKFILMQPSGHAKDEMDESMLIYNRGGFFPNIVALERDQETLMVMISVGMGISILPEFIIRRYKDDPNWAILPVMKADGTPETVDFEASWPKTNVNPAVNQLTEMIRMMQDDAG